MSGRKPVITTTTTTKPLSSKPLRLYKSRGQQQKQIAFHGNTAENDPDHHEVNNYITRYQYYLNTNSIPLIHRKHKSNHSPNTYQQYRYNIHTIDKQINQLVQQRALLYRQFVHTLGHVNQPTFDSILNNPATYTYNTSYYQNKNTTNRNGSLIGILEYWLIANTHQVVQQCAILDKCDNQEHYSTIQTDDIDDRRMNEFVQQLVHVPQPVDSELFVGESRMSDVRIYDDTAHEQQLHELFTQVSTTQHNSSHDTDDVEQSHDTAVSNVDVTDDLQSNNSILQRPINQPDVICSEPSVPGIFIDPELHEALAAEDDRLASESQTIDPPINDMIDLIDVDDYAFQYDMTPPTTPINQSIEHHDNIDNIDDTSSTGVQCNDSDIISIHTTPVKLLLSARKSMPPLESSSQTSDLCIVDHSPTAVAQHDELLAQSLAIDYELTYDSINTQLHNSEPQILADISKNVHCSNGGGGVSTSDITATTCTCISNTCSCQCHQLSPSKSYGDIKLWPEDKLQKHAYDFGLRTLSKPQLIKRLGSIYSKLYTQTLSAVCTCTCNHINNANTTGNTINKPITTLPVSNEYHSDTAVQKRHYTNKKLSKIAELLGDVLPDHVLPPPHNPTDTNNTNNTSTPNISTNYTVTVDQPMNSDIDEAQLHQLREFIRSNEDINIQLLLLQPLDIRIIQQRLAENNITMTWSTIQKLLDYDGIASVYNNGLPSTINSRVPAALQKRRRR